MGVGESYYEQGDWVNAYTLAAEWLCGQMHRWSSEQVDTWGRKGGYLGGGHLDRSIPYGHSEE